MSDNTIEVDAEWFEHCEQITNALAAMTNDEFIVLPQEVRRMLMGVKTPSDLLYATSWFGMKWLRKRLDDVLK